jgi:hypothetical protein
MITKNRIPQTSRWASVVLVACVLLSNAPSAQAHGTLNLYGQNAVAGKKGVLTLTIPHGCGADTSTTKIVMKLAKTWRAAKPKVVAGWDSSVTRATDGRWVLTWTATAGGLPNAESADFPIAVAWPKKPGIYATPTAQYCGAQLMYWKDPFSAAADGDHSYPATYPVPRVKVRAKA